MTNKKTALTILAACVLLHVPASAQTTARQAAILEKYGASAPGLGLNMDGLKASPVPDPKAQPIPVPQQFSTYEAISYTGTAVTAWYALGAQVTDNLPWTNTPTFEAISDRVMRASKSKAFPARPAGQPSLFTDEGFIREYERVTNGRFSSGNSVRFLINGPASFEVKDALIRSAKKSLLVSTWAFYDDTTGYQAAQMLIAKKKEGVDVKVMLDKKVLAGHGKKVVRLMTDAGIEVLKYTEKRANDIWHVKVLIADDQYAVVGGLNFADVYSHKSGTILWRDTDVVYSGPAVLDARKLLADVWNANAKKNGFKTIDARTTGMPFEGGAARVATVMQDPPRDSTILISIIKAMYAATKNINIENAYFVSLPVVTQAVLDARARGVEVNILTNSRESIDPEGLVIVEAMYKCLVPLAEAGASIYLYNGIRSPGDTLHSKFMTVDGEFADIGSYNLHPRGERYDTEVNVNVLDRGSVAQLDEAFYKDVKNSRRVKTSADLGGKPGFLANMANNYFYAQLEAPPGGLSRE
ncbi:MAG: phosphatidylserine/phosphatidylglycerophosphate/cardiolipin synthase family protein [Elusimicrobia bacterium]|nr:phosphatidylserine/phosphatidylglycerophosphate/cardiolipin synthase family protein [Elusimicrobiota bacterium]